MNTRLVKQIDSVIDQLQAIRLELAVDDGFPADRLPLIEAGICLSCGEKIEGEKGFRGCHKKCRREQQRDTSKTDGFFVKLGMLAPPEKLGRKPTTNLSQRVQDRMAARNEEPTGNDDDN